jgi:hypothetical protein
MHPTEEAEAKANEEQRHRQQTATGAAAIAELHKLKPKYAALIQRCNLLQMENEMVNNTRLKQRCAMLTKRCTALEDAADVEKAATTAKTSELITKHGAAMREMLTRYATEKRQLHGARPSLAANLP